MSQSGGGGAVAGSANDGIWSGFKVDASIGTIFLGVGLGGELGGVSVLGAAEELDAAVSESLDRFAGS